MTKDRHLLKYLLLKKKGKNYRNKRTQGDTYDGSFFLGLQSFRYTVLLGGRGGVLVANSITTME